MSDMLKFGKAHTHTENSEGNLEAVEVHISIGLTCVAEHIAPIFAQLCVWLVHWLGQVKSEKKRKKSADSSDDDDWFGGLSIGIPRAKRSKGSSSGGAIIATFVHTR
jgi:hypothetical protein